MNRGWLWAVLLGTLVFSFGCSGSETGKVDENYMKNAEALGKERREIFLRAGTEYTNMTPEDRATYLKGFDNNEENAKKFWDLMKNPPNSSMPSGMQPKQGN